MRRIAAGLLALFATVALAVTAPAAGAHGLTLVPASAGGQSPGELLGDIWVGSLSGRHLPFLGHCTVYERTVVVPHPTGDGAPVRCTMSQDQSVFFAWGAFCGTFDGLYTRAEQLECALGYDRSIRSIAVSVDGGAALRDRSAALRVRDAAALGAGRGRQRLRVATAARDLHRPRVRRAPEGPAAGPAPHRPHRLDRRVRRAERPDAAGRRHPLNRQIPSSSVACSRTELKSTRSSAAEATSEERRADQPPATSRRRKYVNAHARAGTRRARRPRRRGRPAPSRSARAAGPARRRTASAAGTGAGSRARTRSPAAA